MKVVLERVNKNVHLVAKNENGNEIHIDGAPSIGGEEAGFRPMQLLLAGIGGCSTMDIVSILEKQKQPIEDIKIEVTAERQKDVTPALFETIHVKFILKGDLNEDKVKRAVDLSMTKYCSVTKIMEKTATVTYDFVIEK